MEYDFNIGINLLALQKPVKPVLTTAPEADKLYLHPGENETQYNSFMNVVSDLAQAFKFMPTYDQQLYQTGAPTAEAENEYPAASDGDVFGDFTKQMSPDDPTQIWGQGMGTAYSNLDFSPAASDWNMVNGVDNDQQSVLDEINKNFDWNAIKNIGSGESYYQIAKNGEISNYTDEQAFQLMSSMLESRERVMDQLHSIFGDSTHMTDAQVISNISTWLSQYTDVDPHNVGVLKMFFGMETDFINTVDAFMNCNTYWGGDKSNLVASTDLGDFGQTLLTKVDRYISTAPLTDSQKAAAQDLENMWTSVKTSSMSRDLTYDSTSNIYDLGQTNINDSSEIVTVNGVQMTQGTDYAIDYINGKITFTDGVLTSDADTINVTFNHTGPTGLERMDQVGGTYTADLTKTEGSWVKYFSDQMNQMNYKEVVRVIIAQMLSGSEQRQYQAKETDYENRKDDAIQDEMALQKMEQKRKSENQKAMKKRVSTGHKVSKSVKHAKPSGAQHVAPPRKVRPVASGPKAVAHVALRGGAVPVAAPRPTQTAAQRKNDRRVI